MGLSFNPDFERRGSCSGYKLCVRRFVPHATIHFRVFATILYCSGADVQKNSIDQFLIDGNKVKDPDAPVSLELTAGWKLVDAVRWGDHETTLAFLDEKTH